jgi:hypothetical protein
MAYHHQVGRKFMLHWGKFSAKELINSGGELGWGNILARTVKFYNID